MELFPKLDGATAAARAFLTERDANPVLVSSFEAELEKLRIPRETIRAEVKLHAEGLHNAGRITVEAVAPLRAHLEKYAEGHFERMTQILDRMYTDPRAEGENAQRLRCLRDSIAMARARGE